MTARKKSKDFLDDGDLENVAGQGIAVFITA